MHLDKVMKNQLEKICQGSPDIAESL